MGVGVLDPFWFFRLWWEEGSWVWGWDFRGSGGGFFDGVSGVGLRRRVSAPLCLLLGGWMGVLCARSSQERRGMDDLALWMVHEWESMKGLRFRILYLGPCWGVGRCAWLIFEDEVGERGGSAGCWEGRGGEGRWEGGMGGFRGWKLVGGAGGRGGWMGGEGKVELRYCAYARRMLV